MREYTKWDVLCILYFVAVGALAMYCYMDLRAQDAGNDLCVKAGGVYVHTYDEFKCYSTDFRQELKIAK